MLPEPLQIYSMNGPYPDVLRVSFSDGTTKIYYLECEQPAFLAALENIRNMKEEVIGYQKK